MSWSTENVTLPYGTPTFKGYDERRGEMAQNPVLRDQYRDRGLAIRLGKDNKTVLQKATSTADAGVADGFVVVPGRGIQGREDLELDFIHFL